VPCAFYGKHFGSSWNELDCFGHFLDGGEAVSCSEDEECWTLEIGEVCGSQFGWALRRVQWVGEQEKAFDEVGLGGGEDGCLASSVGMTAEIDAAGKMAAHRLDGGLQALLVSLGAASGRRPLWARLTEGEIAAEDGKAGVSEGRGESDKERRVAVCSGAVSEDEAVAVTVGGLVEESDDGDCAGGVCELLIAGHCENVPHLKSRCRLNGNRDEGADAAF